MKENNKNNNFKNIKDLTFEDFKTILSILEETRDSFFSEKKIFSEEEKKAFIFTNISRFFPGITALQHMNLISILENLTEENFEDFKNNNDLLVNTKGDSPARTKRNWELTLETLNNIFAVAYNHSSKTPIDYQIINAKELKILSEEKFNGYLLSKKLITKEFPIFLEERVNEFENLLTDILDKKSACTFLGQLFGYLLKNKKRKLSLNFFVEHVYRRLLCLSREYTENLTIINPKNIEFLENIKEVNKTIFYKTNMENNKK